MHSTVTTATTNKMEDTSIPEKCPLCPFGVVSCLTSCPRKPLLCFLSLRTGCKWDDGLCALLDLAPPTQPTPFKIHPCCACARVRLSLAVCCHVDMPCWLYLLTGCRVFGLFPVWGSCLFRRAFVNIFFHFFWVGTKRWNCWVIWLMYV